MPSHEPLQHSAFGLQAKVRSDQLHCPASVQNPLQHALLDPAGEQAEPAGRQLQWPEVSHTPLQQSPGTPQTFPWIPHAHCPGGSQNPLQHAALPPTGAHAVPVGRQPQCPEASHNPLQQSAAEMQA